MTDTHTTSHIPDEAIHAALLSMAQDNIGADVQGLLMHGFDKLNAKPNALRNALAAASPHLSAPCAVEVMELNWVEVSYGFIAHTAFGTYKVKADVDQFMMINSGSEFPTSYHDNHFEAKAAAQADFERRILTCVVTKPVDVAAVREECAEVVEGRCTAINNEFIQKLSKRNVYEIAALVADHDIKLGAAIRALSAKPAQGDQWQPTHRHVKRGTEYKRLGDAQVQCEDGLTDYELATVYFGSDGELWVRRKSEFEDGRFEPLPAAPTTEAGK